jgi:hypothetical protein
MGGGHSCDGRTVTSLDFVLNAMTSICGAPTVRQKYTTYIGDAKIDGPACSTLKFNGKLGSISSLSWAFMMSWKQQSNCDAFLFWCQHMCHVILVLLLCKLSWVTTSQSYESTYAARDSSFANYCRPPCFRLLQTLCCKLLHALPDSGLCNTPLF